MADKIVKIDIRVKADESVRQLDNISAGVGKMNRSLKNTSDTLGWFKTFTQGLAGATFLGIGIRELVGMADSMTLLTSRISIFVGEGQKTTEVMRRLGEMATLTKSSITDVAEVFSRIITATQRLNISTESQLALTQVLQQSFRLSGSTAAESTASTIQFAQALSFGQLRGQELRSVLSQNSVLATVFGKAIEGSGKDIYKFAEAGGFTTKFVLEALSKSFDDIDSKANKMSQTFAQTLTLAMNRVRVAADEINKEFNLNGKFADTLQWLMDNSSTIIAVLVGLAGTYIPGLTASIVALDIAMLANPVGIFAVALGGLVALLLSVTNGVSGLSRELKIIPKAIDLALAKMHLFFDFGLGQGKERTTVFENIRQDAKRLKEEIDTLRGINVHNILEPYTTTNSTNMWMVGIIDKTTKGAVQKGADSLAEAAKHIPDKIKPLSEQIGDLNTKFNQGRIGVEDFNEQLYKLTKLDLEEKMKAGSTGVRKMADALRDEKLAGFAREFDYGSISIGEFNKKVKEFQVEKLTEKFEKGKISANEFYIKMLEFQNPTLQDIFTGKDNTGLLGGLTSYVESLGTTSQQIADIVKSNFKGMEEGIFQAVTKGKIDFSDFTASVINDLLRMVIRMSVIKPLVDGVLGYMNPTSSVGGSTVGTGQFGPYATAQANGGAWSNGVQFFANGGVFNSPTAFEHSGGLGVLGEKGPEAVMPLTRGSDGKLGVQGGAPVTVNIINQNGSSVEAKETNGPGGRVIEVLVKNIIKDGMGSGEFDKVMKTNFGTSRRGQ